MSAISVFKSKIEKQREFVISAIRRLRKDDPFANEDRSIITEPGTDAAALFGHEQAVVFEERLKKELAEIEKALSKIKDGTYGLCERCGKRIETKRLAVKPRAIYCLKCENLIESKK